MKKRIVLLSLLVLVVLGFLYLKRDYKRTPPTLYLNGNIITLNDAQPVANMMLVVDGKIEGLGEEGVEAAANYSSIEVRDLQGATVMPGFIDVHTHFALSMFLSDMHDLSGFTWSNNAEVWAEFERVAANAKPGEWLMFKGLDPILVSDLTPPTMAYLDAVAPNNPVVICTQSLHSYYANSAAFNLVGITPESEETTTHSYYEKDASGNYTGLIVEQEAFKPFIDQMKADVLTPERLTQYASNVMNAYAANGNTTIVSTGLLIADSKPLYLMQHLSDKEPTLLGGLLQLVGQLPERKPLPRHFMYMRYDRSNLLPESPNANDFYGIIGVKHWYDGSPYTGSMYISKPYLNTKLTSEILAIPQGSRGEGLIEHDALLNFIREYHQKGWQLAFHTQGDAAVRDIVNAFAELEGELDYSNSRHRLEHCLLLPEDVMEDMARMNLTPSFHINHILYYGDALNSDVIGPERAQEVLPIRKAMDHQLTTTIHADQPMFESLPFRLIQTAVERTTKGDTVLGADQKLTLTEAIKALTINAAWQIGKEDQLGTLEVGKYADFIILNKNPYDVPTNELENIECVETYVGGERIL